METIKSSSNYLLKPLGDINGMRVTGNARKLPVRVTDDGNDLSISNELCVFYGFKLRSYDEAFISWFQEKEQVTKFQLIRSVEHTKDFIIAHSGIYEGIEIAIGFAPTRGGWAIDFSGSFHKFSNEGKHNYNDFYWPDFRRAVDAIENIFNLNSEEMEVVKIENGVNIESKFDEWLLDVPEIIDSIISIWDRYKMRNRIIDTHRDSFWTRRGDKYFKAYFKGLQFELEEDIMRWELVYGRARSINNQLGIRYLSELKDIRVNEIAKYHLLDTLKTIHVHQYLDQIPSYVGENFPDISKFGSASYWRKLQKSDKERYHQARYVHKELIRKYAPYSLADKIIKAVSDKLFF